MLEEIIVGVLEFLKSSEFTAVMASCLAIWQIIRGVVGKFASAKIKSKERSYIEALLEKDKTIDKLLMKHELIEKLYLDNLTEIKTIKEAITNMTEAQKITFNNLTITPQTKELVLEILNRKKTDEQAEALTLELVMPKIAEEPLTEETKKAINKIKRVD